MNNPLVKLVLISLLLLMITAPFAGLAPLMLIIFGLAVGWAFWLLVQAFFSPDSAANHRKAEFESSKGE